MTRAIPWRRAANAVAALAVLGGFAGCAHRPIPVSGLRPVYPPPEYGWAEVDSLQPTLRWSAYAPDRGTPPASGGGAITNVRYDLRLWRAQDNRPVAIVYQRSGLAATAHRVATPLAPDSRYFWSVRARFELDGETRLSPWTVIGARQRTGTIRVHDNAYLRFETPSAKSPATVTPAPADH